MIILLLLLTFSVHAAETNLAPLPNECGEYQINGVVRLNNGPKLVIHEKTQSQIIINFPTSANELLEAYKDVDVTVMAILDQRLDGTNTKSSSLKKIQMRVPNPLNPRDTGFSLVKSQDCQKL